MPKEYSQKLREYEWRFLETLQQQGFISPDLRDDLDRFRVYLDINPEHANEVEARVEAEYKQKQQQAREQDATEAFNMLCVLSAAAAVFSYSIAVTVTGGAIIPALIVAVIVFIVIFVGLGKLRDKQS
ncbi:hypothetical protein H6F88_00735 [Oculatella sp. FACHB-28]|uniref:hypothetical protein n=1 Tax=Oculatella sp. FACHB-28 TaxID=2692845 RepID=UPI00168208B1|nr:hypothetical protein [Oculatella sp. FACHB-28]MBD2054568.1 hypothetical protein [Oculatella sp. FACHB-28]